MTYEKDPFFLKDIPDFALQPAREADEYNFHYIPRGAAERFDAAAYEKVLKGSLEEEPPLETIEDTADYIPVDGPALGAFMEQPVAMDQHSADNPPAEETPVLETLDQEELWTGEEPQKEEETVFAEISEEAELPTSVMVSEEAELPVSVMVPEESEIPVPVMIPIVQPIPIPKVTPVKIIPASGSVISSKLKLVDIKQKTPVHVYIEEDILVPDIKPDLARIITLDGKLKLAEKEIHTGQNGSETLKVTGDLILQTLYVPESSSDGEKLISIESKLPFRSETELKTGPYSDLLIAPTIESIDYTVINERKFKVKISASLNVREYSNVNIEVFEGIHNDEVQMLKEKIYLTDVALRKTEAMEIKEELALKENLPEIDKILKYDVNVVENHKQITKEKAVINASVYCNIMYLGTDGSSAEENTEEVNAAREGSKAGPVLYQGKTEFTQFIRFDEDQSPAGQNPAGSKVSFNLNSLNLTAKEDGNGKKNLFELDMNIDTGLELYKNLEKEVVTDVYHHIKDIQYETDEIGVTALTGSGVAELSVREIVNVPERYGSVDQITYISGNIVEKRSFVEQGKSIVEGNITIGLICSAADEKGTAFSMKQDIPFRSAMEIPGITSDMVSANDIALKELWFEKINNRQIEVNAGILINTAVSSQKTHQLVKNLSFLEGEKDTGHAPGIILYIARAGDTIWKIAKKYKTTIDEIKKMNDLEFGKEIKPGTKLLIVAKKH